MRFNGAAGAKGDIDAGQAGREKPRLLKTVTIETGVHPVSIGEAYRQAMIWLFDAEAADKEPA